jgi:hypothetical protein
VSSPRAQVAQAFSGLLVRRASRAESPALPDDARKSRGSPKRRREVAATMCHGFSSTFLPLSTSNSML